MLSVSECALDHQVLSICKPCRKIECGDEDPLFCLSLLNFCWGDGECYCEPGFVWDAKAKECVDEEDCSNKLDYSDYEEGSEAENENESE